VSARIAARPAGTPGQAERRGRAVRVPRLGASPDGAQACLGVPGSRRLPRPAYRRRQVQHRAYAGWLGLG